MHTRPVGAVALLAALLVGGCSATTVDTPTPTVASPSAPSPTTEPTTLASAIASDAPASTPAPSPTSSPTSAPTATPTSAPAANVPPAAPTHVHVSVKDSDPGNVGYATKATITITFQEANPDGVTMKVYGVIPCLPKVKLEGTPCLSRGTPLPASTREFAAQAAATDGKVTWTWPAWEDIGGAVMSNGSQSYESIVIAAYNPAGHSRFVIVDTSHWCDGCTY